MSDQLIFISLKPPFQYQLCRQRPPYLDSCLKKKLDPDPAKRYGSFFGFGSATLLISTGVLYCIHVTTNFKTGRAVLSLTNYFNYSVSKIIV